MRSFPAIMTYVDVFRMCILIGFVYVGGGVTTKAEVQIHQTAYKQSYNVTIRF